MNIYPPPPIIALDPSLVAMAGERILLTYAILAWGRMKSTEIGFENPAQ